MKFITVAGTRPSYMKVWAIDKELRKRHENIIVDTGQHYDFELSEVFIRELEIRKPHYNLGVGSGTHAYQTAEIMLKLEKVLVKETPDIVIVEGDTNSTLGGALTAAKLHIPVAHVESGLRRFDLNMPEEINRVVADHLSTYLFAPSEIAMKNLNREGLGEKSYLTGDVLYDTFLTFTKLEEGGEIIEKLGLQSKDYILATVHRNENTDKKNNLATILQALEECNEHVVFPAHPRTRKRMEEFGLRINSENVLMIEPVGYLEMLALEKHAKKIVTDSGGVQREAYWHAVPCITLLNFSEWVETVECGWNFLAGVDKEKIVWGIKDFEGGKVHPDLYGDGHAVERIIQILEHHNR
ncbi:MAG: non-hydrolyzing UDP-N-acetylglucosamine 2-epimerase [Thermoplasmata archaeon]